MGNVHTAQVLAPDRCLRYEWDATRATFVQKDCPNPEATSATDRNVDGQDAVVRCPSGACPPKEVPLELARLLATLVRPDATCTVCCTRPSTHRLRCGHKFCLHCLQRLRTNNCPVCRAPLDEPITFANQHRLYDTHPEAFRVDPFPYVRPPFTYRQLQTTLRVWMERVNATLDVTRVAEEVVNRRLVLIKHDVGAGTPSPDDDMTEHLRNKSIVPGRLMYEIFFRCHNPFMQFYSVLENYMKQSPRFRDNFRYPWFLRDRMTNTLFDRYRTMFPGRDVTKAMFNSLAEHVVMVFVDWKCAPEHPSMWQEDSPNIEPYFRDSMTRLLSNANDSEWETLEALAAHELSIVLKKTNGIVDKQGLVTAVSAAVDTISIPVNTIYEVVIDACRVPLFLHGYTAVRYDKDDIMVLADVLASGTAVRRLAEEAILRVRGRYGIPEWHRPTFAGVLSGHVDRLLQVVYDTKDPGVEREVLVPFARHLLVWYADATTPEVTVPLYGVLDQEEHGSPQMEKLLQRYAATWGGMQRDTFDFLRWLMLTHYEKMRLHLQGLPNPAPFKAKLDLQFLIRLAVWRTEGITNTDRTMVNLYAKLFVSERLESIADAIPHHASILHIPLLCLSQSGGWRQRTCARHTPRNLSG